MNRPGNTLRVERGQPVQARHVRDLAQMIDERTYIAGYNVRRRETLHGVIFEAIEQQMSWHHPWETDLAGDTARVAPGVLNGEMPWLDDGQGWRPLDGLTEEGERHPKGAPTLKLYPAMFTPEGYSWGALRVFVDVQTGKRTKPKAGGLTLVQTMQETWQNGGSIDQVEADGRHYGDFPLFTLRRPKADKTSLGRLTQNAMFHQQHRFVAGEKKGTHFFWA